MGNVVRLVPPAVSKDTLEMLGAALEGAKRDGAIGGLLVIFYAGRHYVLDAAGIAKDDPDYARGMLCRLDDKLATLPLAHQK